MRGFFYAAVASLIFYLTVIAAISSSFWLQFI